MNEIVPAPTVELVEASEVPSLLEQIRPAWQAKDLINRVRRLIAVDPSSACQRLFNASIHDLREKIIIAGIDIAREAAKQHKLPPVEKPEDIERYSTAKIIDLAHRIGLLSRPDWRRLSRCYEIRRDLEHEDDEYEAGVEDCVYIFQTCINVVLSKDPIYLIRVNDVKELVEQPEPAVPAQSLLEDYEHAPQPRQEEILKFLAAIAMDEEQAELVRQNAFAFLTHFSKLTLNPVKLTLASHLQDKITKVGPTRLIIRIAYAAGVLPYLKQAHLRDFFLNVLQGMKQVGYHWRSYTSHGELLRSFKDVGGLLHCPADVRIAILKWLVLAYLGEPGGRTSYGNIRHVFYSNTAAPIVEELISDAASLVREDLRNLVSDRDIKLACCTSHIERRLENLLDLVTEKTESG
ncbi:MAG: hypothetical protein JRI80_11175 [Deltaproteobacteria bacterium]|nr:hypothetical protein [Deltaproteobacteria bacterium]